MNKFFKFVFLVSLISVFLAGSAYSADRANFSVDKLLIIKELKVGPNLSTNKYIIDENGQVTTASGSTPVRRIRFPLSDFRNVVSLTGSKVYSLLGEPRLGQTGWRRDINYPYMLSEGATSSMVWPQYHPLDIAETKTYPSLYSSIYNVYEIPKKLMLSPSQIQFVLPDDYRTGGVIKMLAHQEFRTPQGVARRATNYTSNRVVFRYRTALTNVPENINESPYEHLPVAIGTANYYLSPVEVSFPITAGGVLEAGKLLTFQYSRMRDPVVVDDAKILDAWFEYNPKY